MISISIDGEQVGLVCQNPVDPDVPNPGKWFANVLTVDCFPFWFESPFDTGEEAVAEVKRALKMKMTEKDLERYERVWLNLR